MKTLIKILSIATVILVLSGTSFATVLYSPPMDVNGTLECRIANVSKSTIQVFILLCNSVSCLTQGDGFSITPGGITELVYDTWSGPGICEFTIDSKATDVRASACVISSTDGSKVCLSAQ